MTQRTETARIETEINAEIKATMISQKHYGFGMKNKNAKKFGECERKLEQLWRELDAARLANTK